MDVYLGFGLLSAAIVVLIFIVFDHWYKSKKNCMAEMTGFNEKNADDSEFVLGHDSNELTHLDMRDDHLENTVTSTHHAFIETPVEIDEPASTLTDFSENETPHEMAEPEAVIEKPVKPVHSAASQDSLLIMSVMAKPNNRFASYDLLQAITTAGLQYGEMNIFHYYQQTMTGKTTLFSLASANKPGDFDLNNMGDFSCTGLVFFMDIARLFDPQNAFRLMLETAERLAEDLEGELRADPRTPWNEKKVWQYQQKIMQYKTSAKYDSKV